MVLTELQLPQKLAQSMIHWTNNRYLVLLILNVFFLILGCFLHSAAAIILTVPIVMPLVTGLGIDPIHFGIVLTINLGIGQQTPPVASVLITACAISKEDVWEVSKVNIWYIGVMVLVLVLVTYFPMLSLWPLKVFY
jgi:C4-dicarboxylate transporter, DctM subunit